MSWKVVLWIKGFLLSCGAGEFGSVMEGRLSQPEGPPQKVAVKTMKCKLSLCPTGYQHSQYLHQERHPGTILGF